MAIAMNRHRKKKVDQRIKPGSVPLGRVKTSISDVLVKGPEILGGIVMSESDAARSKKSSAPKAETFETVSCPTPTPFVMPLTSICSVGADGIRVLYREAGAPDAPVVLLLHGFPASSFMFRELIPRLAGRYRVIAPDLPGFGFTEVREKRKYIYSFESLAATIATFTEVLQLNRYALYVFDYGAPYRLAHGDGSSRTSHSNRFAEW
jgi:alpha/beta hydrolase fold